jgi:hypothetical protein
MSTIVMHVVGTTGAIFDKVKSAAIVQVVRNSISGVIYVAAACPAVL